MYSQDYLFHDSEKITQYKTKNIKDWDGQDCIDWASDTEREMGIPITSWLSLANFGKVTGRDLRRYKEEDFKRLVDVKYATQFFKSFRKLVKERKEDAAKGSQSDGYLGMDLSTNFMDTSSNWTVPQMKIELEVPTNTYGLSYNGYSPNLSPAHSPSFFSLSTDEPSPLKEPTPTYFTQPDMLSGGRLLYGTSDSSTSQSYSDTLGSDFNYLNIEAAGNEDHRSISPLLPDFKSLMIGDGNESYSDQWDLAEMDSILNNETFKDLDQYVHSDASLDYQAEGTTNVLQREYSMESTLNISSNDSLEESMLKKIPTGKRGNRVRHPQSWEFLIRLLLNPKTNPSLIKWEDKEQGIFRLVQKEEIAKLWGKRSQKHKSDPLAYDNFARIIRYHYRSKILLPVSDKHLVYKLGDAVMEKLRQSNIC